MKKYFVVSLCIAILSGCEQVIELKTSSDFNGTVFVEGLLVVGKQPRIYISEALPFARADVTPQQVFARGAVVTLTDSGGSELLAADSAFDKFRCRWTPFYQGNNAVVYGEKYHLEIEYEGRTYSASTEINQTRPNINQVTYTAEFFDIYGGHDGVNIKLQDADGPGNFYRFQMNRQIDNTVAHAHVLDVIQSTCTADGELFWVSDMGRAVFNDEGNDGQELQLLVEVSFEYSEGDSAWIAIQSLDDKAAMFYKELDDQLISILNPFVEPVFLESVINGGAVGFFGSAVLSDSVLFIYPQDNP